MDKIKKGTYQLNNQEIKILNSDEKIAEKYLKTLKPQKLIFEPNGNIPPDFEFNNNIGIEVRRLNKQINGKAIEELEYGEIRKIESVISNFKLQNRSNTTNIVSIFYSRPLKFKGIKTKITHSLQNFETNDFNTYEYQINDNFSMKIDKGFKRFENDFEVMLWVDHDRGGLVKDDLKRSLIYTVESKEKLISKYRNNYKEWWLILVNHISLGITSSDLEYLKQEITQPKCFKKIIILGLNNQKESIITTANIAYNQSS